MWDVSLPIRPVEGSRRMVRLAAMVMLTAGVLSGATGAPCAGQEPLNLPEGVAHVTLPPGAVQIEHVTHKGKQLLLLSAGELTIYARQLYFGDGRHAMGFEATKDGMQQLGPGGRVGRVLKGMTYKPETPIRVASGDYYKAGQLKAGSLYATTASLRFEFKKAKKRPPKR